MIGLLCWCGGLVRMHDTIEVSADERRQRQSYVIGSIGDTVRYYLSFITLGWSAGCCLWVGLWVCSV